MIVDNPIPGEPLAEGRIAAIRQELERLILAGDIAPGERLNELSLAARLGVSRGPLREAVRLLEQARLVEIVPNRGALVRRLGLAEALDLFDLRAGYAAAAGRLLAQRATRPQIRALEELHTGMQEAAEEGDAAAFQALNLVFHTRLFEFAGNERLRAADLEVRNELQLYIRSAASGQSQLRRSNDEHGRLLDAIANGDAARAGRLFEAHVLNGKHRLMGGAPMTTVGPR